MRDKLKRFHEKALLIASAFPETKMSVNDLFTHRFDPKDIEEYEGFNFFTSSGKQMAIYLDEDMVMINEEFGQLGSNCGEVDLSELDNFMMM